MNKLLLALGLLATLSAIPKFCYAQGDPGGISAESVLAKVIIDKWSFNANDNSYHSLRTLELPPPPYATGVNNPNDDVTKSISHFTTLTGPSTSWVENNSSNIMTINVSLVITAKEKAPAKGNSKSKIKLDNVTAECNLANGAKDYDPKTVTFSQTNATPGWRITKSGTWSLELNNNP